MSGAISSRAHQAVDILKNRVILLFEILFTTLESTERLPALVTLMMNAFAEFVLLPPDLLTVLVALLLTDFLSYFALAALLARSERDLLPFRIRPGPQQVACLPFAAIQFGKLLQAMLDLVRHPISVRIFRVTLQNVDEIIDAIPVQVRMTTSNLVEEM